MGTSTTPTTKSMAMLFMLCPDEIQFSFCKHEAVCSMDVESDDSEINLCGKAEYVATFIDESIGEGLIY